MAARKPNKLATVIHWKNDLASFNKVKKEARAFKKELAGLYKGLGNIPSPSLPTDSQPRSGGGRLSRRRGVGDDAHIKLFRERQKQQDKFAKSQEKSIKNFLISNKIIRGMTKEEQDKLVVQLKQAKTQEELNFKIREQKALLIDNERRRRQELRLMQKQNFLQDRLTASSKQMAGNYVSAFAAAGGVTAVTTVGQNFESIGNTMLAVSENSQQAQENLAFVREEALRLGVSYQDSARSFSKMLPARGNMSLEQTKELFSGVSEMSTLLGLNVEQSGRAMTALTQIMSKNQLMAEELKGQLGEVMPNAIKLMAQAAQDAGLSVDGTVKELFKLMEAGAVASDVILPHFAKRLQEAARANGGLDKAIESNRAAMNRLIASAQIAGDETFRAGYADGLTDLFNTSAEALKDLTPLFKSFGKIMGSFFHALARGIQLVTPPLQLLGIVLDKVTDVLGDFSGIVGAGGTLWLLNKKFGIFSKVIGTVAASTGKMGRFFAALKVGLISLSRYLVPVILAFGALEELMNFFYGDGSKRSVLGTYKEFQETGAINSAKTLLTEEEPLLERWKAGLDLMFKSKLGTMSGNMTIATPIKTVFGIDLNIKSNVDKEGNITNFVDSRVDEKVGNMVSESMSGLAGGQ